MSRLSNVEAKDSLLVKVKSGIQACIQMDIIKDMPEFLIPNIENSIYTYTSEGVTFLEDRFVNVVHFEQKKGISEPLFAENYSLILKRAPYCKPVWKFILYM